MAKLNVDKKHLLHLAHNYALIILGCFILSLGSALFLTKLSLVSGGITGLAIIIQHYVTASGSNLEVIDIIVWALSIFFLILSFFLVGKKFAFRTLLASIASPLFLTLSLRVLIPYVPFFRDFQNAVAGDGSAVYLLLCGLFGGLSVGAGCSITFLGGGSTGGVDVLIFLAEKYLHIRESIASIIIDGTIIVIGLFCLRQYVAALCGILSAAVASIAIELFYNRKMNSYQVDIISNKNDEISKYVQEKLGRGTTFIPAIGGYKGEERKILRIVFPKDQYEKIRFYIAEIDPDAFLTFTTTDAVFGEGFKRNRNIKKIKNNKK